MKFFKPSIIFKHVLNEYPFLNILGSLEHGVENIHG